MQIWNALHAPRWKHRTQKSRQKSPFGHHRTMSGYIFATKARIDNRKKTVKMSSTCPHNMVNFGLSASGWDRSGSLRHTCKFQRVSRLGSVTARHSSSGRQPNFAALNRGRHLYSAGRPSRWASAHVLVMVALCNRADHYIFILWFLLLLSIFYLSFSSPILRGRRLYVYYKLLPNMVWT